MSIAPVLPKAAMLGLHFNDSSSPMDNLLNDQSKNTYMQGRMSRSKIQNSDYKT